MNAKTTSEILHEQGLLTTGDIVVDVQKDAERKRWETSVAEETAEWDHLEVSRHSVSGVVKATEDINFSEALQHFQVQNLQGFKNANKVKQTRFAQLVRFLFGPRRLQRSLIDERNLLFYMAQVQMNNDESMHCRVLQTIYKQITGAKHNCPRFGPHWEIVGFQGSDPATDLRGAGFLALMHLLHLVCDHRQLCGEIYNLSTHYEQNFPLALVSINATRIALTALREDRLSSICNKRKQVVTVMNEFYLAIFNQFYFVWRTQHKTMKDSGHVLKDLEKFALKEPGALLKSLEAALAKKRPLRASPPPPIIITRLSIASSTSDVTLQSPAMMSQSLDVVLQPLSGRDQLESNASEPRFAGVHEIGHKGSHRAADKESEGIDDMTTHL